MFQIYCKESRIIFFDVKNFKLCSFSFCAKVMVFSTKICGLKYTLRGGENLSQDKTCVFVANHQSGIDLIGKIKKLTKLNSFNLSFRLFTGMFGELIGN